MVGSGFLLLLLSVVVVFPFFFFFLGKISPELTTANPPLFAEEAWPWANIRAHLPLLYMRDAYHSMACQAVPCLHPGSEPANPGLPRSGTCELNRYATGPAPHWSFLKCKNIVPWKSGWMSSWLRQLCRCLSRSQPSCFDLAGNELEEFWRTVGRTTKGGNFSLLSRLD